MATTNAKTRDGGIEVLRCVLMFLVILHHCCQQAVVTKLTDAQLLSIPTLMAVDGFVAISGLYGIRFSWKKLFGLYGQAIFWSLATYLVYIIARHHGVILSTSTTLRVYGGWFLAPYLALMCFAPILNAGLDMLKSQGVRKLWAIWGGGALVFWLSWLPWFPRQEINMEIWGWKSHTFSTLCFVYITMRVIALTDLSRLKTRWITIVTGGMFLTMGAIAIWFYLFREVPPKMVLKMTSINNQFGYNSPWVVGAAVSLTLLCRRWSPPYWVTRVATFLGPSMFAVYLLHVGPRVTGRWLLGLPVTELHKMGLPPIATCLIVAAFCFISATCLDLIIRRGGWACLRHLLPQGLFVPKRKEPQET